MKREGLVASKFKNKTDYYVKRIFKNSSEEISKYVEKKFRHKKKKVNSERN